MCRLDQPQHLRKPKHFLVRSVLRLVLRTQPRSEMKIAGCHQNRSITIFAKAPAAP